MSDYIKRRDADVKILELKNKEIRNKLDNCLPIDEAENTQCWELIGEIVDIEIELESWSNQ